MNKKSISLMAFLASFGAADAAVVMTINQNGDDVVMAYSGTLDVTGLTRFNFGNANFAQIRTDDAYYNSRGTVSADQFASAFSSVVSGSPTVNTSVSVSTGDLFMVWVDRGHFWLASDYVSGEAINGSATFEDTTLAAMGLIPEVTGFVSTLNNGTGDTISLSVGSVPEPSSIILLSFAGSCLLAQRSRKQQGEQVGDGDAEEAV